MEFIYSVSHLTSALRQIRWLSLIEILHTPHTRHQRILWYTRHQLIFLLPDLRARTIKVIIKSRITGTTKRQPIISEGVRSLLVTFLAWLITTNVPLLPDATETLSPGLPVGTVVFPFTFVSVRVKPQKCRTRLVNNNWKTGNYKPEFVHILPHTHKRKSAFLAC